MSQRQLTVTARGSAGARESGREGGTGGKEGRKKKRREKVQPAEATTTG